ncbi:MAG: ABC transporter ATP-binding protein [Sedimentisphaerales bacterium]|nr:ABC transporter ATP-binding protein [Sedimentisphaerales bacterium]
MSEAAVQFSGVSVRAGRRTILELDALRIERGAMVGLLGPNGSGKSTLLRCCLGMQTHVQGDIEVLGQRIAGLGVRALGRLRRRIGLVPQVLPSDREMPLTVREVVAIGRTASAGMLRPLRRADWRIVDEWLERLGLAPLAGGGYSEISGGEQRKVLIARVLVGRPEILLLDEPTANLDWGWRQRLVQLIEDLYRQMHLTVLLVCHDLDALPAGCRRAVFLCEGRLIADGCWPEIIDPALIRSLYGPGLSVRLNDGRMVAAAGGADHA